MLKYLPLLFILPVGAEEFDIDEYLNKTHITIGVAHKVSYSELRFKDTDREVENSPSARIELYYQASKRVKFGISHHSQWFQGAPFNDDWEYSKTEIFIDYTFSLGDVF